MSLVFPLDFSGLPSLLGLNSKSSTGDKLYITDNTLEHSLNHPNQDEVRTADTYTPHVCVDNMQIVYEPCRVSLRSWALEPNCLGSYPHDTVRALYDLGPVT